MRIHRVGLRNFRGVTDSDVAFSTNGVTIVEGPNEVGKSSLPEAIRLAVELPDSSEHSSIRSVRPVHRDKGPEVEIEMSTGDYSLLYRKRWRPSPMTALTITAPRAENRTGREAHDRLIAILETTLDADLWRALSIEQGTELSVPHFDVASMSAALDRAVGGDGTSQGDDALWDRIRGEYDRYWTLTGQVKGDRKSSQQLVDTARAEVDECERRLQDLERDSSEMHRMNDEVRDLSRAREADDQRLSELEERHQALERSRREVDRLSSVEKAATLERDAAAGDHRRRCEQIDELQSLVKSVADLQAESDQAAPALAAAESLDNEASTALAEARSALQDAHEDLSLARQDRDHFARQVDLARLAERAQRHDKASRDLLEAEALLEAATVDDNLLERLEQAHMTYETAKASADVAAASVETTALRDVAIKIGSDQVQMAAGDVGRSLVDDELVVQIADLARLRVRAAPQSKSLAEDAKAALTALRRVCDEAGVSDLSEARQAAKRRSEAQRRRDDAKSVIDRELEDLTPDALKAKINAHSKRVCAYLEQRSAERPFPADLEEAEAIAQRAERAAEEIGGDCTTRESAASGAAEELQQAQVAQTLRENKLIDKRNAKAQASALLELARQDRDDGELSAVLAAAQQRLEVAQSSLREAERELSDADPDSVEALLDNARDASARAGERLQSTRASRNELRGRLDLLGEQGLHTRLSDAQTRLDHAEREHARTQTRAEAAKLLKNVFETRRMQARQRYIGPFTDGIDRLGRIVFGPTFAVELNDDLGVARRTLNGVTLDIDQLSAGAREQLGLLSRLACAEIVSPNGAGAPVMIDDALGWSDPQRLESVCAAINSASKQCQIIVLTCTPTRYAKVGNATVVRL